MTTTTTTTAPTNNNLTLNSPCKINLFLRILSRRPDGYHNLASLFQVLELHDNLHITLKTPQDPDYGYDSLTCTTPGVPTDDTNLILQAFKAYRARCELLGINDEEYWFRVALEKRVPFAAGLGGGSGNAATALWGANELIGGRGTRMNVGELGSVGAEFGSDVSVFFSRGCVMGYGRGEVLEEVEGIRGGGCVVYLVKPMEGLETGKVFGELKLEEVDGRKARVLLEGLKGDLFCGDCHVNDLEKPSFRLLPRLGEIKAGLVEQGFRVVSMSGSGTTFYCLGEPDEQHADGFLSGEFEREHNVTVFKTRFIHRPQADKWYFERADSKAMALSTPFTTLTKKSQF